MNRSAQLLIASKLIFTAMGLFSLISCTEKTQETLVIGIDSSPSLLSHQQITQELQSVIQAAKSNVIFTAGDSQAESFKGPEGQEASLLLGVGLEASLKLAQLAPKQPLFFTNLIAPEESGIYNNDLNIAGYSGSPPVSQHLQIIKDLLPEAKVIGQIFARNDLGSKALNNQSIYAAADLDLSMISLAVNNSKQVRGAVRSLLNSVDVIYLLPDPVVLSSLDDIKAEIEGSNIPLILSTALSQEQMQENNVLLAMSYD